MFRPAQSGHLQVQYNISEYRTVCNAYEHIILNENQVSSLYIMLQVSSNEISLLNNKLKLKYTYVHVKKLIIKLFVR